MGRITGICFLSTALEHLKELIPATSIQVYWYGPVFQGRHSYQVMLACKPSIKCKKMTTRWFCADNDAPVSVAPLRLENVSLFARLCLIPVFCFLTALSPPLHISFFILLLFPHLSFLGCLRESSLCVTFCLRSLLCSLSLSPSQIQIHPHLVSVFSLSLSLFYHSSTSFLPGLCHSPPQSHPRPPTPILVSLGSVVIKSDSSLAENNKQSLLKSAIAV